MALSKTVKWVIAGAAILLVALCVILLLRECNRPTPEITVTQGDSTQYYKNKKDQEIAAIKMEAEEYTKTLSIFFRDSIAKLHNTKDKLVQEIAILRQKGMVVITETAPPIIKTDTVQGRCPEYESVEQNFKNAYYDAYAFISLSGGKSRLKLETRDTLRVVAKTVKEGSLFKQRTYLQVDAVNSNPFNRIEGLQVYKKALPRPKKVSIGPYVGYGISNSLKPAISVGLGVQWSIIRL